MRHKTAQCEVGTGQLRQEKSPSDLALHSGCALSKAHKYIPPQAKKSENSDFFAKPLSNNPPIEITSSDLFKTKNVMASVRMGQRYVILHHERVVAELIPFRGECTAAPAPRRKRTPAAPGKEAAA